MAIVLPFLVVLVLGVVETGSALLESHTVSKLAREGSNLISRDTTLADAVTAMRHMSTGPVNFDNGSSKLILSVVKLVATTTAVNYNRPVLYQRREYGTLGKSSRLTTVGAVSFGPAPDYHALDPDNNPAYVVTNLPADVLVTPGGMLYITEIHSRYSLRTPLNNFGITMPEALYSIAYF